MLRRAAYTQLVTWVRDFQHTLVHISMSLAGRRAWFTCSAENKQVSWKKLGSLSPRAKNVVVFLIYSPEIKLKTQLRSLLRVRVGVRVSKG